MLDGSIDGPYTDHAAARWARQHLLPAEEFFCWARYPDDELAGHFGVPIDQVTLRRSDPDYLEFLRDLAGHLPPATSSGAPFRRTYTAGAFTRRFRIVR